MVQCLEVALSHREIPGETALCIYIAGCTKHCAERHYSELQDAKIGDLCTIYSTDLIHLIQLSTDAMFLPQAILESSRDLEKWGLRIVCRPHF